MTRPGRPRKGEENLRRDQLLDHALRLFVEQGYGNVSIETIAREARVSLRTIYQQFGGKPDLFGAAIRRCSDIFVATLPLDGEQPKPCREVLTEFAEAFLFQLTRAEPLRLRTQIMAEAHRFPELAAEFYIQGPGRTLERLAQFFEMRKARGEIVPADANFLAGQFIGSLRGERFQRLQLGLEQPPSEEEVKTWARQAVDLFVAGCVRGQPGG